MCSSPFHSSVKKLTYIGTSKPQFYKIHFIDHRVLRTSANSRPTRTRGKQTLVAARRALAEQNTSLTGSRFVVSLARSRALIAALNEGRASLRLFGGQDLVAIVE